MQNTTYFNLDVYEGSDIFNPLTVENANMEKIDEQLFLNSIATVGQAVELKSGTVHAITRTNPDASMFRFVATSRYDEGDTFTVDGIQVTGLLTDGTTLSDGAYAINANVLCCLTGTVLTLYTVPGAIQTAQNALKLGGQIPEYYGKASDVEQATLVAQAAGTLANQVNSNLTVLENNKLVYNSLTDKIDVYANGVLVGSLNAGFQFDGKVFENGIMFNNFTLGTVNAPIGLTKSSNATLRSTDILINRGSSGANSGGFGCINGLVNFNNYNTLNALVNGNTVTVDISDINNGYIAFCDCQAATDFFNLYVSSDQSTIIPIKTATLNTNGQTSVTITKIWLER